MDFWISGWISGFQSGFLDFRLDFWISQWISGFQFGFLPMVYEISFVTDPSIEGGSLPLSAFSLSTQLFNSPCIHTYSRQRRSDVVELY